MARLAMLFVGGLTRIAKRGKQCSDVSVTLFPMNQVSTEVDDPFLRRGW